MSRIKILFSANGMHGTKVFVDDVEVHGIRDITIRNPCDDIPTVTLELIGQVEIEGDIVGNVKTIYAEVDVTTYGDAASGYRRFALVARPPGSPDPGV